MPDPILVTELEYRKGERLFAPAGAVPAPADEEALAERVRATGARVAVVGVAPYRGPLYKALGETAQGRGALLARFGVGHDSVDKEQAHQHGIVVTNTPGALDNSVAEHALGLMLALARHVGSGHAGMMEEEWRPATGTELHGKTLGLVGFGAIARRVSQIAALGFGMTVIACGRRSISALAEAEGRPLGQILAACGASEYTPDVDRVLAECDLASLHIPGSECGFMNEPRLARLPRHALLINTSRGSVCDEVALYQALAAGSLRGAALDVYAEEPYRPARPDADLRTLPNVLLTPHIGSNTEEANARMAESCLRNVEAFLQDRRELLDRVG